MPRFLIKQQETHNLICQRFNLDNFMSATDGANHQVLVLLSKLCSETSLHYVHREPEKYTSTLIVHRTSWQDLEIGIKLLMYTLEMHKNNMKIFGGMIRDKPKTVMAWHLHSFKIFSFSFFS